MKKKVCLATWYGMKNPGSFLQAFAMYKVLDEKYDVFMLDKVRCYGFFKTIYMVCEKMIKKTRVKNKKSSKIQYSSEIHYKEFFKQKKLMNSQDLKAFENDFDFILIGGDQLWNPYYLSSKYLVNFSDNIKKISYGTSFGVERLPNNKIKHYKKYLAKFQKICVRENQGVILIKNQLNLDSCQVLDSVFLLTREKWRNYISNYSKRIEEKNYILCYFVDSKKEYYDFLKSKYPKKKIIVIPLKDADFNCKLSIVNNISPFDFLNYIQNADFIITDSFHAISFSIIFNKNFNVVKRFSDKEVGSQNSRIISILSMFSLNYLLKKRENIDIFEKIDYSEINRELINKIKYSKNVLNKMEAEDTDA